MTKNTSSSKEWLGNLGLLVVSLLSVVLFYGTGQWYQKYWIASAGVQNVPVSELVFYAWYMMFGLLTVVSLTLLFARFHWPTGFRDTLQRLWARPQLLLGLALGLVLVDILLFQAVVLMYEPICDDELTYRFIAQTLLQGRVSNPLPPEPLFFKNIFVVMTKTGWHGKYPIGHPLLLAIGEAVNLRFLIPPLLTCGTLWLTVKVGEILFENHRVGLLAGLLLVVSPHFVLTGGTELSQVSSTFCLMLGIWTLLRFESSQHWGWGVGTGLVWGFGVLVRPMPGALFLVVVGLYVLFGFQGLPAKQRIRAVILGIVPIALMGVLFLMVNRMQTGNSLKTGYHQVHGAVKVSSQWKLIAGSVAGALLRQKFWFLGFPLIFVFVLFVRNIRRLWFVWGLLLAEYTYRILFPKTVVSTTGPVYVAEIVPLLALLVAWGMLGLRERLDEWGVKHSTRWIGSFVAAGVLASLVMFVPVQLKSISAGVTKRRALIRALEPQLYQDALVFVNQQVPASTFSTWAYNAPNPHPSLKETIVYVRLQYGLKGAKRNMAFWKKYFPKRAAWVFYYYRGRPILKKVNRLRDFMPDAYWKMLQNRKKHSPPPAPRPSTSKPVRR